MDKNYRPYLAELIGTFVLVFVGGGVVLVNQLAAVSWLLPGSPGDVPAAVRVQPQPGLVGIALASGLALAVALAVTLPYSSGYLNPAFTLMLWVYKRLDGARTAGLIFCQMLGGALAGGLLRGLFAFNEEVLVGARLGSPHLNLPAFGIAGVTTKALLSGVGLELVLTFILTFAIFGTMIDPRAPRLLGRTGKWLASLWVGLAMVAISLVGFNFTGAAANPARWFGTVLWEMTVPALKLQHPFDDQLVYWVGPIVGALLAGGIYTALILPSEERAAAAGASTPAGGKVGAGASSTLFRAKK